VDQPLKGKVALVTGSARGVGRAIARKLADMGATIVVTARTLQPRGDALTGTIHEAADEIERRGGTAMAIQADLSVPADIERLAVEVIDRFGGVDILVNNAADTSDNVFRGFWETPPESWIAQYELNLHAMYRLIWAFAPGMRARGGGFVINIGSAKDPDYPAIRNLPPERPVGAAYLSSKMAVYAMSALLSKNLSVDNIFICTLNPGAARSESFEKMQQERGFDPSHGIPVETAALALEVILRSPNIERFAGEYVNAPELLKEHAAGTMTSKQ